MSEPGLSVLQLGPLTSAQRGQLIGEEANPFDSDERLKWRESDRYVALAEADDRLVAAAGLANAVATVAGTEVPLVGIGGVIVRADRRGRGFGLAVMQAALEQAASSGREHALLFCWPDRVGFYAQLGFVRVDAPVTVAQPDGKRVTMHLQMMWRGLSPNAAWPPGNVALEGLPF